jgi:hypothetical protein
LKRHETHGLNNEREGRRKAMSKMQKRYVCNGRRELRQESPSQNARAVDRKVTYDQAQSHGQITSPKPLSDVLLVDLQEIPLSRLVYREAAVTKS